MAEKKSAATTAPEEAAVDAVQAAAEVEQGLPLPEFCQQLSQSDRRVELIAGFYSAELAAGRTHGVNSEFQARFVAFANQPA